MASGDTLSTFYPHDASPPSADYATHDVFLSADSPAQTYPVLDFDSGATVEYADFAFVVPSHYTASAGCDVKIGWTCDTDGGALGVVWAVRFKRVQPDAVDLDSATFHTEVLFAESNPASAGGEMQTVTKAVTFALMDSPLAGELLYVRLYRATGETEDDLAEDAEFHFMEITEA